MAVRAMWKGVIKFGDAEFPVKLYSAVEDRSVRFRLLHEPDRVPVSQEMVDPETDEPVPSEEVRRGYETEDGSFVVLEEEELEALQPEKSRDIEVTGFVERGSIGHQWYDRPYWLGPDGDAKGYFALARALEDEGREGFARWTMRNKEYQGSLRAAGEHLLLITLRNAEEVVPASALEPPTGRELDEREMGMAVQLVEALEDSFEPERYADEYRERVLELIERKAAGEEVEVVRLAPRRETEDEALAAALEQSVKAARERKSA